MKDFYTNNKKLLVFFCAVVLSFLTLSGCASATYEVTTAEGVTKKIKWISVGSREIKSLEINPDTGTIKLGSSKGDAGALGNALENATGTTLNLSETLKVIP